MKNRKTFQRELEEELQFHLDMQARDYEREGLAPEEAFAKATRRFGNFAKVKKQCLQIILQGSRITRIVKLLFTIALLAGLLIRGSTSDSNEVQIGNMLIAIAILGGLVAWGHSFSYQPAKDEESLGLGLDDINSLRR